MASDRSITLVLFQRDQCHLCDLAYERLAAAGVADFDPIWIDGDVGLEARYGRRIPVLRREDSGRELDWPFDAEAIRAFLGDSSSPDLPRPIDS